MRPEKRAQRAIKLQIYHAVAPYLKYPPTSQSEWYLPIVREWSRALPPITPSLDAPKREWDIYAWQLKLTNKFIIPEIVTLPCFAVLYLTQNIKFLLEDTLRERSGLFWFWDYSLLEENAIELTRIPSPLPDRMTLEEYESIRTPRTAYISPNAKNVRLT